MRRRHRFVAAPAVALVAALLSASADADTDTRLRVAQLRALVEGGARPAPVAPAPVVRPRTTRSCGAGRAWGRSTAELRLRTRAAVRDASLRFRVPGRLIEAVIRHESNGNPDAVSHAGAQGLMQLMPATARQLGVVCAFDPRENVLAGTRYLRRLHDRFGSWSDALAAYNAGPAQVARGRGLPAETRTYVTRVLGTWQPHPARPR